MFSSTPLPEPVVRGVILTVIGLVWVISLVRILGLRTLSKMTAFDFIVTLAAASSLATAICSSRWSALLQAMTAVTTLFSAQFLLALTRKASSRWKRLLENEPLFLMRHGQILEEALRKSRVSRTDLFAKLREANAVELHKVYAVVLETTGDISVLYGEVCDPSLIEDVRVCR